MRRLVPPYLTVVRGCAAPEGQFGVIIHIKLHIIIILLREHSRQQEEVRLTQYLPVLLPPYTIMVFGYAAPGWQFGVICHITLHLIIALLRVYSRQQEEVRQYSQQQEEVLLPPYLMVVCGYAAPGWQFAVIFHMMSHIIITCMSQQQEEVLLPSHHVAVCGYAAPAWQFAVILHIIITCASPKGAV